MAAPTRPRSDATATPVQRRSIEPSVGPIGPQKRRVHQWRATRGAHVDVCSAAMKREREAAGLDRRAFGRRAGAAMAAAAAEWAGARHVAAAPAGTARPATPRP